MKTFKIAHLYYDLMNLYGENGNLRYLSEKLQEQDIKVEIHFLTINDKIDFEKYDFYYIGMGSEENQDLVLKDIIKYKKDIKKAINNDKLFLITGNSLELFGEEIKYLDGTSKKTLATFNYKCQQEEFRIIGEQFLKTNLIPFQIIGFQNRQCIMSNYQNYLFEVIKGCGYDPKTNYEGIIEKNFMGTYLLGPILIRNPHFCDYLIKRICNYLNIKYQDKNKDDFSYKAYDEYLKNFQINNS